MAHGYWFQLRCDRRYPEYAACSMACLDAIAESATGHNGVMNKTHMEAMAIKAAKPDFYQALLNIGRADAFNRATAAEMEGVIETIWEALHRSMTAQTLDIERQAISGTTKVGRALIDDEIPF
jgi:hypothetical protein